MTIRELIAELSKLPQDRSIICQVVGQDAGAWNMEFDFKSIERSDWAVQLRVSHPELINLPMGDDIFENGGE
jgi:hypothetical protein